MITHEIEYASRLHVYKIENSEQDCSVFTMALSVVCKHVNKLIIIYYYYHISQHELL